MSVTFLKTNFNPFFLSAAIPAIPKGTYTVRKQTRQVTRPKARTAKAMVCPAPQKPMKKRMAARKATKPKMTGHRGAGNTTMGVIDATGNCVCPMPGRAGAVTRSMTAARRKAPVVTRRGEAKKPMKKSLKMAVRKQKVRRQNRKRPAMKKQTSRKAVMECP